jgi:glycosyltransferase involved in cell wall biosynthesis
MTLRLAILATHPVQYFVPVFRGLATCSEWQTRVFLGCLHGVDASSFDPDFGLRFAWDCDLLSGYAHTPLTRSPLAALSGWRGVLAAPGACERLLRWKPDAVLIFAYSPAFITVVSLLLALRGVPILLRADTSDEAYDRGPFKGWLRDRLLRLYYKRCSRFYPIGTDSLRHYLRLGVPRDRLETVLYAIDTSVIQPDPPGQTLPPPPASAPLRLGYVGKFTPVKDPLILPKALQRLDPTLRERVCLEAAGDGPLLDECRQAMEAVIPGRSHFHGFLNQSALPAFYRSIDLLILPSIQAEVWGLVVNEALSLGARVLVSDRVGCRHDLVVDPWAGWVFKAGDPSSLAETLALALESWPWPRVACAVPEPRQLVDAVRRYRLPPPRRRRP